MSDWLKFNVYGYEPERSGTVFKVVGMKQQTCTEALKEATEAYETMTSSDASELRWEVEPT